MKINKSKVIAVFTILLAVTALITGCSLPDGGGSDADTLPPLQAGKARVTLQIGSPQARAILHDLDDITGYYVMFIEDDGNISTPSELPAEHEQYVSKAQISSKDFTADLTASPGGTDYVIRVYAVNASVINEAAAKAAAAADGQSAATTLVEGASEVISVTLTFFPFDLTNNGKGRFEYTNNWLGTGGLGFLPTSATMEISVMDGVTSVGVATLAANFPDNPRDIRTLNSTLKNTGSVELGTGKYLVQYEVQFQDITVYYREVLHIYQNLTSKFELVGATGQGYDGLSKENFNVSGITVSVTDPDPNKHGLKVIYTPSTGTADWERHYPIFDPSYPDFPDCLLLIKDYSGTLSVMPVNSDYTPAGPYTWYIDSQVTPLSSTGDTLFIDHSDNGLFNTSPDGENRYHITVIDANGKTAHVNVTYVPFYKLGDIGPGGGKIFYFDPKGFYMSDNGEYCHYLEAAPVDQGSNKMWSSTDITSLPPFFGSGRYNTERILFFDPSAEIASICNVYSNNGKTDWFLPSQDELNELYKARFYVDNLLVDFSSSYASSTADYDWTNYLYWVQRFDDGSQEPYVQNLLTPTNVFRAIRAF